jgi:hypothetical protein
MSRTLRVAAFFQIALLGAVGAFAEEAKPIVPVLVTAAATTPVANAILVSWENDGTRAVRENRGGSLVSWESSRGTAANFVPQAAFMNTAATNMRRQYEIEEAPAPLADREPVSRIIPLPKAPPASSEPATPDYMTSRGYVPSYTDYSLDVPVQNAPQSVYAEAAPADPR